MSDFVNLQFTADADTLTANAISYLQSVIPGWVPADGNLEVWLLAAHARINAELTALASNMPAAAFRQFGTATVGLPPITGTAATITTIWTPSDLLGHVIPAGTQVGYRVSGDTLLVFVATADVTIPAGAASLSGVVLTAVGLGVAWNGIPTGPLELVDSLSWVSSVVATTVSSGGVDPETDDAYQARLTDEFRLLAPRPILPGDFSVMALNVTGVFRALTVDGWDPGLGTGGHARTVCVFPLDAAGAACSSGVRAAVAAYLGGRREVGFVINTGTPTSTTINVTYQVHVLAGYDPTATLAACTAAVQAYLSPANWDGGMNLPPTWSGNNKVRYLALSSIISNVPGVGYVAALTVNSGTSDITLSGTAPLPAVGTVTGTTI